MDLDFNKHNMANNGTDNVGFVKRVLSIYVLYTAGIVMLFIGIVSLILNVIVLDSLRSARQLRKRTHRLAMFLFLDEILVRVLGSPLVIASCFAGDWLFGGFGCIFYAFAMTSISLASISLHTAIAVERYIFICHPLYRIKITKRVTTVIGVACHIHGLIWGCLPLIGWSEYMFEDNRMACSPSWSKDNISFVLTIFSFGFFLPLALMLFCYLKIEAKIKEHNSRRLSSQHGAEIDLSNMTLIIVATFVVCWTPYAVIAFFFTLGINEIATIPLELTLLPLVCAKSAGMWTPVIYCARNKTVRREIRRRIGRLMIFRRQVAPMPTERRRMEEPFSSNQGTTLLTDEYGLLSKPGHIKKLVARIPSPFVENKEGQDLRGNLSRFNIFAIAR